MMTPRERVLAALRLEAPDRVPWLEIGVAGPIFGHVIGEEVVANSGFHPLPPEQYRRYLSQAIRGAQALGLCGVPLKTWNTAFQANVTREGAKVHGRGGRISDPASFEACIASAPAIPEHLAVQCAPIYFEQMGESDLLRIILVGGIFSHAEASMGAAEFAIACHEQPELVERLCAWMGDQAVALIDAVLAHGEVDAILLGDDIAFKTTTFISPAMLRRFVFPQYHKIAARIRQAGVPMMFHSDGNLTRVMEDLLGVGIACIHPFENLAVDIRWAKATYGDRLCIMGNLDVDLIERKPPAEVRAEAARLIRDLGPAGYIFASGNSITQWAPPQSALAMAEAVRER